MCVQGVVNAQVYRAGQSASYCQTPVGSPLDLNMMRDSLTTPATCTLLARMI